MTARLGIALLLGVMWSGSLAAAEDLTLRSRPPLKTARKEPPRQGGPLGEVEVAMWIPADVKTVRGAIFNPFNVGSVEQKHWQEAARHWRFAILGANYFGVQQEEFATTLNVALQDFAAQAKRPELEHLPLCGVGMSAGAGMCIQFAKQMPDRFIALAPVCLEVGPNSPELRAIPIVTIFGERDGRQMEQLLSKLPDERAEHAQWAIAVQWKRKHEFAKANNLAMPWFDRVIALRYPKDQSPAAGPVKLVALEASSGWIGTTKSWDEPLAEIKPTADAVTSGNATCWFPDSYTAHVWQSFVAKDPSLVLKRPRGLGDGQPFTTLKADSSLTIEFGVTANEQVNEVQVFNGEKPIARFADGALLLETKLPRGIHALSVRGTLKDGRSVVSSTNTVIVD